MDMKIGQTTRPGMRTKTGGALKAWIYCLPVVAGLFILSIPKINSDRKNIQIRETQKELARVMMAKQEIASETKVELGTEFTMDQLIEESTHISAPPVSTVEGEFSINPFGEDPTFSAGTPYTISPTDTREDIETTDDDSVEDTDEPKETDEAEEADESGNSNETTNATDTADGAES